MRRQLSLIALVLIASLASACAAPTGPSGSEECTVVAGTQTRCDVPPK
jgi:hypothetical protein